MILETLFYYRVQLMWIFIGLSIWFIYNHIKKLGELNEDTRGYYRNGYGRLVHRIVAYKYLYSYPFHSLRFGEYDVHHKDGNKKNNLPSNLEILTREEHKELHGH